MVPCREVLRRLMLTPRQFAEIHGVAYTTVMSWLQKGLIPEAVKNETPSGHYWEIPETASPPELTPGRPSTRKPAHKATAKKRK